MTNEDKLAKAVKISESIIGTAEQVGRLMKQYPAAKRGRRITKNFKRKKAIFRIQVGLSMVMGASNVARILAQPIPKFSTGGVIQHGMAVVGESGNAEAIEITPDIFDKAVNNIMGIGEIPNGYKIINEDFLERFLTKKS